LAVFPIWRNRQVQLKFMACGVLWKMLRIWTRRMLMKAVMGHVCKSGVLHTIDTDTLSSAAVKRKGKAVRVLATAWQHSVVTLCCHLSQRAFEYNSITAVTNIRPDERRSPDISLKQATYKLFIKLNISYISCFKNVRHLVTFCKCTIHSVLEYPCFLLFVWSPLFHIIKICPACIYCVQSPHSEVMPMSIKRFWCSKVLYCCLNSTY
jgi:hypothetical protein